MRRILIMDEKDAIKTVKASIGKLDSFRKNLDGLVKKAKKLFPRDIDGFEEYLATIIYTVMEMAKTLRIIKQNLRYIKMCRG